VIFSHQRYRRLLYTPSSLSSRITRFYAFFDSSEIPFSRQRAPCNVAACNNQQWHTRRETPSGCVPGGFKRSPESLNVPLWPNNFRPQKVRMPVGIYLLNRKASRALIIRTSAITNTVLFASLIVSFSLPFRVTLLLETFRTI
jgi:hypothetical protein